MAEDGPPENPGAGPQLPGRRRQRGQGPAAGRRGGEQAARRRPAPSSPPGRRAREVALEVLRRVRERDAYANLVLPALLKRAQLPGRDAALATELAYGTLRCLGTLDWVIALYATRPLRRIDPPLLDALRLGVYQLLFTSVPPHAAIHETVGCLHRGQGFVNAVLRRISAERDRIPWPERSGDPVAYLEIRHCHPSWIARLYCEEFGFEEAEALCRAQNAFPGVSVWVNPIRAVPEEVAARLEAAGLEVRPGRFRSDVLVVRGGGPVHRWPGFAEGWFVVQDESSTLAAAALQAERGEVVVDLCAGPGGKTAHLSASGARVVAGDLHAHRARLVAETTARLGLSAAVLQADGRRPPLRRSVDAVLVDAPCSGLGVLRRRPEARWRVRPADVRRSADLQAELLRAGFGLLRPGGRLVYAVCTLTRAETGEVLQRFLSEVAEAELEPVLCDIPRPRGREGPALQLLPHIHGTDGMFIARLRKRER